MVSHHPDPEQMLLRLVFFSRHLIVPSSTITVSNKILQFYSLRYLLNYIVKSSKTLNFFNFRSRLKLISQKNLLIIIRQKYLFYQLYNHCIKGSLQNPVLNKHLISS